MNIPETMLITLLQRTASERGMLLIWTVYDHPTDMPDHYVARCFVAAGSPGAPFPLDHVIKSKNLDTIRDYMEQCGLTKLMRNEGDAPKIIETWL